jgi:prefoldin alpha subunit
MNQEILERAMAYQQQAEQAEQGLAFINEQIQELTGFRENLGALKSSKGKTLISSIGSGVFVKTQVLEEELFVNVGAGVVVKKSPEEVKEVIGLQLRKFQEAKTQLQAQLEMYASEMQDMIHEIERLRGNTQEEH